MKALKVLVGMVGLFWLPFQIYMSWLLYRHVQATELMWFLWWVHVPVLVFTSLMTSVVFKVLETEKK